MWGYDEWPEVERSEMDLLLEEYKDKCMDLICGNVNSEINAILDNNARLIKENEKLRKENTELKNNTATNDKLLNESKFMIMLVENVKQFKDDNDKIYKFLDCIFDKDYIENTYGVPLWIGTLTQYYSHKEEVLQLLRILDVKLPENVDSFRLPIDWTEEEMDIFFSTMYNHYVCNSCIYQENLRFWNPNALKPVDKQCKTNYSEIPWQYVLRNSILKKEKYLVQIGKHLTDKASHWGYFSKIDEYLDLNDDELKIILENIDFVLLTKKTGAFDFAERHLKLITNQNFLDKMYETLDSYNLKYYEILFDMPFEYTKRYCKKHKDDGVEWIKRHSKKLTEKQRKELLTIVLG